MRISTTAGQVYSPLLNRVLLQWSLHNIGQEVNGKTGKVNADINWDEAIQIYSPQQQTGVAVIDSGMMDHPEISLRLGGKILEQNGIVGVEMITTDWWTTHRLGFC